MVTRSCLNCGKSFLCFPSQIIYNKGGGSFCSIPCKNEASRKSETVHDCGYILLKKPNHHRANFFGFVYQHHIVAEKKLRRRLRKEEIVHHIDGDPKNNKPDNLEIMTRAEHARMHAVERAKERGVDDPNRFKKCPMCSLVKLRSDFSPTTNRGRPTVASYCRPCAAQTRRKGWKLKGEG
jgi:hypothetical protein